MSNENFRMYWEMSPAELYAYIQELEHIIMAKPDDGAKIWKDELGATKAALLASEARAKIAHDHVEALLDIAQRKISGMSYMLEGASAVCQSWAEYETVNRMLMHHVEGVCRWLNAQREVPIEAQAAPDRPADWDDIPF